MFGNTEIEKSKLYHHKTPIFLGDVNTEKSLVSHQISFLKKTITTLFVTWILPSIRWQLLSTSAFKRV